MTHKFAASMFVAIAAAALAACAKKEEAPAPAPAPVPAPVAQAAPPKPESFKEFKLGGLDAFALRDGILEFPNDNKVFGIGKNPADVAAVLTAAGQPTDKIQLGLDPLLVKAANKVLLFDTGAANNFGLTAGNLLASMSEAKIDPATVTDIFISHVHGDHVGGVVSPQGTLIFPNATIHISKAEWKFMTTMAPETAKMIGLSNLDEIVKVMQPKVAAFAPGANLIPGLVKAVDIKGHTPGHSGYEITSGGEKLLYVGDSMHSFAVSVAKPDWVMGFDSDPKEGAKSRVALVEQLATSGERVYAVHFPFPSVGKIVKDGDSYKWVGE